MTASALLAYSLASSLLLAVAAPALWAMVRRGRSARLSRVGVLVAVAVSLVVPVVSWLFHDGGNTSGVVADSSFRPIPVAASPDAGALPSEWLSPESLAVASAVYLAGFLAVAALTAAGYLRLASMIARSRRTRSGRFTLCRLDGVSSPFSWGRYVFLPEADLESGPSPQRDAILTHEIAHVDCRHWIDVALLDAVCILQWYNPAAWLVRRLGRLSHELEADAAVVASGTDAADYQRLVVGRALESGSRIPAAGIGSAVGDLRVRMAALSHGPRVAVSAAMIAVMSAGMSASGALLATPAAASVLGAVAHSRLRDVGRLTASDPSDYWLGGQSADVRPVVVTMDENPCYSGGRFGVEVAVREALAATPGAAGVRGVVKIAVDVGADGHPTAVGLLGGITPRVDDAVVTAIARYNRYVPSGERRISVSVTLQ